MQPIAFKRLRFPPDVIRYAVWLYFRFTLSVRDVKELLAQRGIEASREAIRCRVIKFGPLIAAGVVRAIWNVVAFGPSSVARRPMRGRPTEGGEARKTRREV